MDQEKETKRQAERCRALAQRVVRELTPASIQVLGGSGALAEQLLEALTAAHAAPALRQYTIVEVSASLRQRQQQGQGLAQ